MNVSTQEMAALLNMSTRRINQLAAEGIAVRVAPGTFDGPATIASYIASIEKKAAAKDASLDADLQLARQRRAQADAIEMKNARTRAHLLSADEVESEWSDMARRIRSGVLSLTSRIRASISFLDADHAEIIDRECRLVLRNLADDIDQNHSEQGGKPTPSSS